MTIFSNRRRKAALTALLLSMSATMAAIPADLPRPNQPLLVELLDSLRGQWVFRSVHGQQLAHPGPVPLTGSGRLSPDTQVEILLDHPEFPGDAGHAELRRAVPRPDSPGESREYRIEAGVLTARLTLRQAGGRITGELTEIGLGDVADGTAPVPAALYLSGAGGERAALLLAGGNGAFKIETDRVGSVFDAGEPVVFRIVTFGDPAAGETLPVDLELTDFHTGKMILKKQVTAANRPGEPAETRIELPLNRFGSFRIEAKSGGRSDALRFTRIPQRQELDPEISFVGMNVFQQQLPYWTYQLPLYAKAGVRWVRPWLHWENSWKRQSPRPGEFRFDGLDMMINRLERYGQKYEYILYGLPEYTGADVDHGVLDAEGFRHYEEWLRALAGRYRGRIREYEVHNEPDLMSAHNPALSGEYYAELVRRSSEVLKKVDPEIRVHTLSHSNCVMPWLEAAGAAGVASRTDVVTLHSYAAAAGFTHSEEARQRILERHGFSGKPQWFNEIAIGANDESPHFSTQFKTSEARQARELAMNYAQSVALAGKGGKAFWFCSYDPKDGYDENIGWDGANGLLYLGFQPKSAFAALAALARMLDGRECAGYAEPSPSLRQVSFEGPAALAWSLRPGRVPAVTLGCGPDEELQIFDLFGNPVASGPARKLRIDFTADPVYLFGSVRMAEAARAAAARRRERRQSAAVFPEWPVQLAAGEEREIPLAFPAGSEVRMTAGNPLPAEAVLLCDAAGNRQLKLTAGEGDGSGLIRFHFRAPGEQETRSNTLKVTVGERGFIRDGGFDNGDLSELDFEWYSPCSFDPAAGAGAPGSLKYLAPFDSRTRILCASPPAPDRDLHFSARVRGRLAPEDSLSFHVAFTRNNRWLGTWVPAHNGHRSSEGPSPFPKEFARIPSPLPNGWTELRMTLPAAAIPKEANRIIFHIDLKGGAAGTTLSIDDLRLFQKL